MTRPGLTPRSARDEALLESLRRGANRTGASCQHRKFLRSLRALVHLRVVTIALVVVWASSSSWALALNNVSVVVSGAPDIASGVEVVVRELLSRHPVVLEWSRAAELNPLATLERRNTRKGGVLRACIDLSDTRRAVVYWGDPDGGRFIVRFLPLQNGYDELAREEVAHVLESAVVAYLKESGATDRREEGARPLAVQGPAAPEVATRTGDYGLREAKQSGLAGTGASGRTDLFLGYASRLLEGAPVLQHGPAVALAASHPTGIGLLRVTAWISAQYEAPVTWDRAPVGIRVEGGTFVLAAGPELDFSQPGRPKLVVRGLVGIGVNTVHVSPFVVPGSNALADPDSWQLLPVATLGATIQLGVAGPIHMFTSAGGEVDLSGTKYDLRRDGAITHQLSPWWFRPTGLLGIVVAMGRNG